MRVLVEADRLDAASAPSASATPPPARVTVDFAAVPVRAPAAVCVWRGDKPADASEASERGPTDLLARILSANNGALLEDGASRGFEVAVEPELARNMTAAGPAVLSFFLAMATEAFWSQGASCHAAGDMDVGTSATPVAAGGEDVRRYRTFVDKMVAGNAAMQRMTRGD